MLTELGITKGQEFIMAIPNPDTVGQGSLYSGEDLIICVTGCRKDPALWSTLAKGVH